MKHAANSLEYHFMPFTSNREFKRDPRLYVKSEGVHYWSHEYGGRWRFVPLAKVS